MGLFDGLPVPSDKTFLRDQISTIDESWAAARFDSLPLVVHILTSKDREGEIRLLKEQTEVVEEVVDEVVHAYHGGFNKAIQNYSQILRLFSESTSSVTSLKVDLAQAKQRLGSRNKQLHQLWYRSVTLRHISALLDQIESILKVPSKIEKLISEKQFYAAVQVHIQSIIMLEREGLQTVGALQDIRSELSKLKGILFYKILEDLHLHLYNKGQYSLVSTSTDERDDELPTTTSEIFSLSNSHSLSRRTRLMKAENLQVDGSRTGLVSASSVDAHEEDGLLEYNDGAVGDGYSSMKNGDAKRRDANKRMPSWLLSSTPDEFVEAIRKSDAPAHVKYLQTMVECLCMLGKVAAAGAVICQRLRPTVHEIITSKIMAHAQFVNSFVSFSSPPARTSNLKVINGQLYGINFLQHKHQNGVAPGGVLLSVSPVSPLMSPCGKAQAATKEILSLIFDTIAKILENHVVVGELLETKSALNVEMNTPRSLKTDTLMNTDSDVSQVTGGFSIGLSLAVFQSECQQLICEIVRATPEAASTDSSIQTTRLASNGLSKEKKDGSEDGLTFSFRFSDATLSVPNQGADLIRQGWRRGQAVSQEGYGSAALLPEQGIYLAASVYRPVLQFTDKVSTLLPKKHTGLGYDALLVFIEKFIKDHFLPALFVDYRKSVQQSISSPTAFRPRAHPSAPYTSSLEKGRPILQGLIAIDYLANEVLGWAEAIPKFAGDIVKYMQTFLERTYERCRTSYMEAVLEKQSYMVIGRHDMEKLMRLDPASACLPFHLGNEDKINSNTAGKSIEIESELSDLLLALRPVRQENLIRDDNKLILLACLSDSLEYVAESIERLALKCRIEVDGKSLTSFADDYKRLAIDCLKVLRTEMQLETIFHLQEMTSSEYLEDPSAEEPDDFIVELTAQITRRDEEMSPFVDGLKRNYIFGGICSVAANTTIKALADIKAINLFEAQQMCRNSVALEQALAAIPSIDSEAVHLQFDHARSYYDLLNMPFEALIAFIREHQYLFTASEYINLLKVQVPGREIPPDALDRVSEILPH